MNYRLYSFVANAYLSPLQCGLQTAHVVSELSRVRPGTSQAKHFADWAAKDKTIIICAAGNHKGVIECFAELKRTGGDALGLPVAIFNEDEQSMNGMATACGVIVPEKYWDVMYETREQNGSEDRWVYSIKDANGVATSIKTYHENYPEGQFCRHLKGYRLA